ncbi:MAG: hypothetical protein ACOC4G_10560 [Bacillota bacterium]
MNHLDINRRNFELQSVTYKKVHTKSNEESIEVESKTKDSYHIKDIDNKRVIIEFKRKNFFEPSVIFDIEIIINLIFPLKQTNSNVNKEELKEEIKKEINDNAGRLLYPASSISSFIITSLTKSDSKSPLVTTPYPMLDEQ